MGESGSRRKAHRRRGKASAAIVVLSLALAALAPLAAAEANAPERGAPGAKPWGPLGGLVVMDPVGSWASGDPAHGGVLVLGEAPACVLEGAPACPIGWDPGQDGGTGDDVLWVAAWAQTAGVAPPAGLPSGPAFAMQAPGWRLPVPTGTTWGACFAGGTCEAPAWLEAEADADDSARALAAALGAPSAAMPAWVRVWPRAAAVVPHEHTEWSDLLPALHVAAGVKPVASTAQASVPRGAPTGAPGASVEEGGAHALATMDAPPLAFASGEPWARAPPDTPVRAEATPKVAASTVASAVLEPSTAQGLFAALALSAWLAIAWGLYTRVTAHKALEQRTRRRIYDTIAANPGVRVGTLRGMLGLSYPVLERHVRLLLRFGLLEAHGDGQRRLFVAGAMNAKARAASVAASTPAAQRVLAHLQAHGSTSLGDLQRELGLPRSTASLQAKRLVAAGLVTARRQDRRLYLALTPYADKLPAPGAPRPRSARRPKPSADA